MHDRLSADPEHLSLRVIETLRQRFPDLVIGLSDHQNGIAMSTAACVLGARVIEKHFTRNRAWKGSDQSFSLEPTGMHKLTMADIAMKSPADGMEPYHLNELVGCELKNPVVSDHPFTDADVGR